MTYQCSCQWSMAAYAPSASSRHVFEGDGPHGECRSYGYDLLRWFPLLWAVDVGWEQATEREAAALVGWLRAAQNPQRKRSRPGGYPARSVNPKTGKPVPASGYTPATSAHNLTVVHGFYLTVVHGFYEFHRHFGRGPVVNPVPESGSRRRALARVSPIEAPGKFRGDGCGPRCSLGRSGRCPTRSGTSCSRGWAATATMPCWPAGFPPGEGGGTAGRRPGRHRPAGREAVGGLQGHTATAGGSRVASGPGPPGRLPRRGGPAGRKRAGLAGKARQAPAADLLRCPTGCAARQRVPGDELDPARPAAHRGHPDGRARSCIRCNTPGPA
jgi:hypothetical protein